MAEVALRPATRNDAADLAILDNIAGHGMSLMFWQKSVDEGEAEDPLDYGRNRFADETSIFGWANATVAHEDGHVLGSVTSYEMIVQEEEAQQFERIDPAFAPVFELFDLVVGDWFVDSLAVYSVARGRGVASMLVDASLAKARAANAVRASLIVEDSNRSARKIYEERGFEIRDRRPFIEFNGPSKTKEWLLLTVKL